MWWKAALFVLCHLMKAWTKWPGRVKWMWFWNDVNREVSTYYFTSAFLGCVTSADLVEAFLLAAAAQNLDLNKLIQVSSDGPNVNIMFSSKLQSHLANADPDNVELFEIGITEKLPSSSCFHRVHIVQLWKNVGGQTLISADYCYRTGDNFWHCFAETSCCCSSCTMMCMHYSATCWTDVWDLKLCMVSRMYCHWWLLISQTDGSRKCIRTLTLLFSERELMFCLSSVCNVRDPTQPIEIFHNVFAPFNTLVTWRHPGKILRRSSQGNPSVGGLNQRVVEKCSDFGPLRGYISETMQDRR